MMRYLSLKLLFLLLAGTVFADAPVASRIIDGTIHYYESLHEAVAAVPAAHESVNLLSEIEIVLLADITIHAPLIIGDNINIRLVADNGNRTIMRGDDFLDYPIIWITGENASLTLGKDDAQYELIIDGGYLNNPPILSGSPLITLNGLDSKLIMYDNVILQNNYNVGLVTGETSYYKHGGGVFVRTTGDNFDRPVEFIMKGGIIRGNANKAQHPQPWGGGVRVSSGIFTLEKGEIMNNITARTGGGVFISPLASFKKTGGVIYGENAPEGYQNISMDFSSTGFFTHAITVGEIEFSIFKFRNNTVKENEVLSYTATITGNGTFGKGEKWHDQYTVLKRGLLIAVIAVVTLLMAAGVVLFVRIKSRQKIQGKQAEIAVGDIHFSPREKEVLELLLKGLSFRDISNELHISISGVKHHSQNIYRKLGIQSRTELLVKFK